MNEVLLNTGVYGIINDELKIAYIGETTRSFLIRFIEHLALKKSWEDKRKVNLLLHNKTEFKILNTIEYKGSAFIFIASEKYYSMEYKDKGYELINLYSAKIPAIKSPRKNQKRKTIVNEENLNSYRRCLKYIAMTLAKKNNISSKEVYIWCYSEVNKKFNTNIYAREGNTTIEKLELNELEYIVLKLFDKYKTYILQEKRVLNYE